jgi:hypothetical protein
VETRIAFVRFALAKFALLKGLEPPFPSLRSYSPLADRWRLPLRFEA